MKILINYLFKFFIPLFYLTFIIAGFTCALISGIIEFLVVEDLLKGSGVKIAAYVSVPLLVVFAFESSKLFLVFYGELPEVKKEKKYTYMRGGLIVFSIFCTLIFSLDKLNKPRVEDEINRQKTNIDERYEKQINAKKNRLAYYEDIMNKERVTGIGERYEDAQKSHSEISEEINSIYRKRQDAIDNIETNMTSNKQTDNKLLSSALSIWNRALYNTDGYTPRGYILLVILLSLLLSFGLEIVIYVSFKILAQTNPKSIDFTEHTSGNPTELIILSIIPGLLIFLGYIGFVPYFNSTLLLIGVTFVASSVGIFIVSSLKSPDLIVKKVERFPPLKIIINSILASIVGGIISTLLIVICISLYGIDLPSKSFYGFCLALFVGVIGKISHDALIKQKILDTDRIIEDVERQKKKIGEVSFNDVKTTNIFD